MDVFLKAVLNIDYEIPEYTTSQLFELWQNKSGYFIKYLYNQKEKVVYELNDFKNRINQKLLSQNEINEICKDKSFQFNAKTAIKNKFYEKIFFIIDGLVVVLVALLISLCILKRNRM